MRFAALYFCLLFIACASLIAANWDVEYWQAFRIKQYEYKRVHAYASAELRLNEHISKFWYFRITENLAYRLFKQTEVELHYSFIHVKPPEDKEFTSHQRIEFEFNPSATIDNNIEIHWRNRFELRKEEKDARWHKTFRHRTQLAIPLPICGIPKTFICSDEVFYNFERHRWSQNRFIPLGIEARSTDTKTFLLYLMIRHFLAGEKWRRSVVFGSELRF